ncbi:MAG: TonB family protein, partial [Rhodospirillales bacterium]|nr:TonB family protein [Rhodospirillales bacterium]
APARPATKPPPRRAAPARPGNAFPMPENFSFNAPAPQRAARAAPPGRHRLDLSLGNIGGGVANNRSFATVEGENVGPDWGNALSAWVQAHAYYPPQAGYAGQQGDVEVTVVMEPGGHVRRVTLDRSSGSVWLDMALTGMFRDANLPPIPGRTKPYTFQFLMHYVLRGQ